MFIEFFLWYYLTLEVKKNVKFTAYITDLKKKFSSGNDIV